MRSVIIDSSSAILIYRCNMISALLKYCNPVIPEAVLSELIIPGYDGADVFIELCSSGLIKVYRPENEHAEKVSVGLHNGEREAISLFYEGKGDFIIIDDRKGGAFCRDNNIPYINALLAVKLFYFKKLITSAEYDNSRRWLLTNGRYSAMVIDWAENADRDKLAAFL